MEKQECRGPVCGYEFRLSKKSLIINRSEIPSSKYAYQRFLIFEVDFEAKYFIIFHSLIDFQK